MGEARCIVPHKVIAETLLGGLTTRSNVAAWHSGKVARVRSGERRVGGGLLGKFNYVDDPWIGPVQRGQGTAKFLGVVGARTAFHDRIGLLGN
jgi:hypothetical protein